MSLVTVIENTFVPHIGLGNEAVIITGRGLGLGHPQGGLQTPSSSHVAGPIGTGAPYVP